MRAMDRDADLHYRTGVTGRLARFIVARRAAGDPFDATIVLPCLIFLVLVRLNEVGSVNGFVWPGLFIPAALAGCWMGICLGERAAGRAILRGTLVGAFEGAALTGLVNEALSQPKLIGWAVILMWVNASCFWFGAVILGMASEILTTTEAEWQRVAPRRAKLHWIFRLVFKFDDIKGVPTGIGLLVRAIQFFGPALLAAYFLWVLGYSPWVVFKSILRLPS
jgi:hypothetical protein